MPSPRFSVFTPSHDARWLDHCYRSLAAQTFDDWEWVVLLNGDAQWTQPEDERVRVKRTDATGIGALKRQTIDVCRGDILVELDHDDELVPEALVCINAAFDDYPQAGLVYSRMAHISEDGSSNHIRWSASHGWEYRDVIIDGRTYLSPDPLAPSPHNVSYIWYAPNHVRAFTRAAYDKVGGYDPQRTILDDQDLMCRLYQYGEFICLHRLLYLQRIHPGNTQRDPETNARIQRETIELYDRNIQPNALAWAKREGLLALDLGAAHDKPEGYLGVDLEPGTDMHGDVIEVLRGLPTQSVGVIRAADFIEHIADKITLMNELHRVLAHGGLLLTLTPSTDGRGAFCDPTHVSFWNELSFRYWTSADYRKYVPAITARYQQSRLFTDFPTPWHAANMLPYVCANLVALHVGPRQGGIQ